MASLKGSKTEHNLLASFAGESQARNRYTFAASIAKKEGFDVITGTFEGIDKHPGTLPCTHKQLVKLIVARESGVVLGGEVAGGVTAGELTNLIGFVIQNRMTIDSILTAQIGTHPLLTAPPTAYPLIKAAEVAAKKM